MEFVQPIIITTLINNLIMETEVEEEGMIIDRPENSPLTEEDILRYKNDGWELSYAEPRITFIPTAKEILSGPTARYIFSRKKPVK